jgi:hypothetical protein
LSRRTWYSGSRRYVRHAKTLVVAGVLITGIKLLGRDRPSAGQAEAPAPSDDKAPSQGRSKRISTWLTHLSGSQRSFVAVGIFSELTGWYIFIGPTMGKAPTRQADSLSTIGTIFVALFLIAALIIMTVRDGRGIIFFLQFTFSALVSNFSLLYWNYGTTANFSQSLSHLDAIYFTVGTLSTAGTGNIVPTSQLGRGLQTAQMIIDIFFLVVAVSLVLARLASRLDKAKSSTD